MVMLLESIGFYICNTLMFRGMLQIKKILKEAKKKDYKLITALPYHTLIVGYCKLTKFDIALKLLTQMKDFGFSDTSLDEYHKLIHPICLMAMDRKIAIKQLEEMEPMDREMASSSDFRTLSEHMTAKVYNRFSNPQLKTCFTLRVEVNEEHKKKKTH
ncbi:pentatricopeptide repeat-containing protein, mitochondrial [Trifolium repens]|nr:pentatricopeptide repeat-containing protein, mitochondrial [Trifolium repens]